MATKDSCQIWISSRRIGNEHLIAKDKIAKKLVYPVTNGSISFRRFGEDLYLANFYGKSLKIENNLQISGQLPMRYQDPKIDNQGIAYVRSLDFFQDETVDLVALVSSQRHLVRIYNRSGGDPLAQIGQYAKPGDVADNKLSSPQDCLFLPNGNLLIVSRNGKGANGTGNGHVSEYDRTGTLIATRLEFSGDGESAMGKNIIYQPSQIKFDPKDSDYIWVSELRGRLLKVNLTSWLVEDMILSVSGCDISQLESFCFLSDGQIAIVSISQGAIGIIDPQTRELIECLDPSTIGATREVRGVIELEPGFLGFTCWSNRGRDRGAYIVPINKTVEVTYEPLVIPENYELARDRLPCFYNFERNSCLVPLDCLELVQDELTIPLRKIC